ncbi:MAG: hypothetical protein ACPHDT_06170, partial [Acidimicrobiales bacterium]
AFLDKVDSGGVEVSVSQLAEPVAYQLTLDDAAGPGWNVVNSSGVPTTSDWWSSRLDRCTARVVEAGAV